MRYDLKDSTEAAEAIAFLMELVKKEKKAEVRVIRPRRSLSQNNYLYLLLSAFGAHFGYTVEEAKTIYKRDVNPSIFIYDKNGTKFLRSSADLDSAEMTKSIDRLREFSAEQGYPLPTADNEAALRSLEREIERNSYYL